MDSIMGDEVSEPSSGCHNTKLFKIMPSHNSRKQKLWLPIIPGAKILWVRDQKRHGLLMLKNCSTDVIAVARTFFLHLCTVEWSLGRSQR
jgi:hypothetical protein